MATQTKKRLAVKAKPASSQAKAAAGDALSRSPTRARPAGRALGPAPRPGLPAIDAFLSSLPALTNIQRHAFRDQWSAAQCDDAGEQTRSADVYREALAWASLVDASLQRAPHAVRRYSKARFAWLLECIRCLAEAIEAQRTGKSSPSAGRLRMERARKTALVMRDEIVEALSVLGGGDEIERRALEAASGTIDSPEALGSSLRALCRLAEGWMERESPASRALVASVDLTTADIDAARAATHALAFAYSEAALGSRSEPRDAPAVNRAEGRVLLEMRVVMRIFERAHTLYPQVPRLVPGAGTRAVLAPPKRARARAEATITGDQPITTREGQPSAGGAYPE